MTPGVSEILKVVNSFQARLVTMLAYAIPKVQKALSEFMKESTG
jgi:hypothetical protein